MANSVKDSIWLIKFLAFIEGTLFLFKSERYLSKTNVCIICNKQIGLNGDPIALRYKDSRFVYPIHTNCISEQDLWAASFNVIRNEKDSYEEGDDSNIYFHWRSVGKLEYNESPVEVIVKELRTFEVLQNKIEEEEMTKTKKLINDLFNFLQPVDKNSYKWYDTHNRACAFCKEELTVGEKNKFGILAHTNILDDKAGEIRILPICSKNSCYLNGLFKAISMDENLYIQTEGELYCIEHDEFKTYMEETHKIKMSEKPIIRYLRNDKQILSGVSWDNGYMIPYWRNVSGSEVSKGVSDNVHDIKEGKETKQEESKEPKKPKIIVETFSEVAFRA